MNQPFDPKHGFREDYVARSKVVNINAPAEVVWDILVDLPRYEEWNPFCIAATSTFKLGDPINMTMKYLWSDETAPIVEYICAYDPPKKLSWKMDWSEEWPYAGLRDQYIESTGPNSCRYWTTDAFLGDSAIHIVRFGKSWIEAGFNLTADALKKRAEEFYAKVK